MLKKIALLAAVSLAVVPLYADDAPAAAPAPAKVLKPTDSDAHLLVPTGDKGIGSDGEIKDDGNYQVRIGELYAPGGESYIMPIHIPTLPAGQKMSAAHLRVQLVGIAKEGNGLYNVDLYGLGVRDSEKILPTDYYLGAAPDSKATLLQAKFLTPDSPVRADGDNGPFVESSADGDAALLKYLNDIISKPENAGKYLFLRLSYSVGNIADGNNAYLVLTTSADGGNEKPVLIYKIAP